MTIRFKCPHCEKALSVKDELAGKRGACPVCKQALVIPAPVAPPAPGVAPPDLDKLVAEALNDPPPATRADEAVKKPIEFQCPFCDEAVKIAFELAGKQTPCPECGKIIKVPLPKVEKPKDWRNIHKAGPTSALMNLPEQLEGAWGTEIKGRVSGGALREAEAIPGAKAQPVGVGGWVRRGLWTTTILGIIVLAVTGFHYARVTQEKKRAIDEALAILALDDKQKDLKQKMPLVLRAELCRTIGLLHIRDDKALLAKDFFQKALRHFDDAKASLTEQDLFLIDLALSQLEMGSADDRLTFGKERLEWGEVEKQAGHTLNRIKDKEAKVLATREIGNAMLERGRGQTAVTLVAKFYTPDMIQKGILVSPVASQHGALVFAMKKEDKPADIKIVEGILKCPLPDLNTLGGQMHPYARVALSEGFARRGKETYAKSMTLVTQSGPGTPRLEAALGAAAVILGDKSPEAAEAAEPFLREALNLMKDLSKKDVTDWQRFNLVCLGVRTKLADDIAKDHLPRLPVELKRRAQLEWNRAKLQKNPEAPLDPEKDFPEKGSPARALAWEIWARANPSLQRPDADSEDAKNYAPFIKLGEALGKQDRAQGQGK